MMIGITVRSVNHCTTLPFGKMVWWFSLQRSVWYVKRDVPIGELPSAWRRPFRRTVSLFLVSAQRSYQEPSSAMSSVWPPRRDVESVLHKSHIALE